VSQQLLNNRHVPRKPQSLEYEMTGAAAVLRKRAVSCSFSSIYHLPKAGLDKKLFRKVDQAVRGLVILPCLFAGGLVLLSAAKR